RPFISRRLGCWHACRALERKQMEIGAESEPGLYLQPLRCSGDLTDGRLGRRLEGEPGDHRTLLLLGKLQPNRRGWMSCSASRRTAPYSSAPATTWLTSHAASPRESQHHPQHLHTRDQ